MDVEPANVIPEPVEATYATSKDAIDELFAHAKAHGYCMRFGAPNPMGKTQLRQNTIMNAIKKAPISLEALVFDKPAQSGLIVTSG